MAPEERATLAELARLRREVAQDHAAWRARAAELNEAARHLDVQPVERPWLAVAAVALHGWYTALESILERGARVLDQEVPQGVSSHRDLLSQAMAEVPGVRPAILPASLHVDLLGLLAFRHFFRHAYAVALDAEKLGREAARARRIEREVDDALVAFDAVMAAAEQAVRGG